MRGNYEDIHQQILREIEAETIQTQNDVMNWFALNGYATTAVFPDCNHAYRDETVKVVKGKMVLEFGGFIYSRRFTSLEALVTHRNAVESENASLKNKDWMYRCTMTLLLRRAAKNLQTLRKDNRLARMLPPNTSGKRRLAVFESIDPSSALWKLELQVLFPATTRIYEQRNIEPPERNARELDQADRGTPHPAGNSNTDATGGKEAPYLCGHARANIYNNDRVREPEDCGHQDREADCGIGGGLSWVGAFCRRTLNNARRVRAVILEDDGIRSLFERIPKLLKRFLIHHAENPTKNTKKPQSVQRDSRIPPQESLHMEKLNARRPRPALPSPPPMTESRPHLTGKTGVGNTKRIARAAPSYPD